MRLIGKLLALPFVLVMGILYLVCKFLVVISGAVLGILSGIVFLAALVGDLVLYLVGVPYMYLIMRLYLGSDATLAALVMKMAVFIPGDLIKLAIVTLAAPPLLRCLEKAGYTRS